MPFPQFSESQKKHFEEISNKKKITQTTIPQKEISKSKPQADDDILTYKEGKDLLKKTPGTFAQKAHRRVLLGQATTKQESLGEVVEKPLSGLGGLVTLGATSVPGFLVDVPLTYYEYLDGTDKPTALRKFVDTQLYGFKDDEVQTTPQAIESLGELIKGEEGGGFRKGSAFAATTALHGLNLIGLGGIGARLGTKFVKRALLPSKKNKDIDGQYASLDKSYLSEKELNDINIEFAFIKTAEKLNTDVKKVKKLVSNDVNVSKEYQKQLKKINSIKGEIGDVSKTARSKATKDVTDLVNNKYKNRAKEEFSDSKQNIIAPKLSSFIKKHSIDIVNGKQIDETFDRITNAMLGFIKNNNSGQKLVKVISKDDKIKNYVEIAKISLLPQKVGINILKNSQSVIRTITPKETKKLISLIDKRVQDIQKTVDDFMVKRAEIIGLKVSDNQKRIKIAQEKSKLRKNVKALERNSIYDLRKVLINTTNQNRLVQNKLIKTMETNIKNSSKIFDDGVKEATNREKIFYTLADSGVTTALNALGNIFKNDNLKKWLPTKKQVLHKLSSGEKHKFIKKLDSKKVKEYSIKKTVEITKKIIIKDAKILLKQIIKPNYNSKYAMGVRLLSTDKRNMFRQKIEGVLEKVEKDIPSSSESSFKKNISAVKLLKETLEDIIEETNGLPKALNEKKLAIEKKAQINYAEELVKNPEFTDIGLDNILNSDKDIDKIIKKIMQIFKDKGVDKKELVEKTKTAGIKLWVAKALNKVVNGSNERYAKTVSNFDTMQLVSTMKDSYGNISSLGHLIARIPIKKSEIHKRIVNIADDLKYKVKGVTQTDNEIIDLVVTASQEMGDIWRRHREVYIKNNEKGLALIKEDIKGLVEDIIKTKELKGKIKYKYSKNTRDIITYSFINKITNIESFIKGNNIDEDAILKNLNKVITDLSNTGKLSSNSIDLLEFFQKQFKGLKDDGYVDRLKDNTHLITGNRFEEIPNYMAKAKTNTEEIGDSFIDVKPIKIGDNTIDDGIEQNKTNIPAVVKERSARKRGALRLDFMTNQLNALDKMITFAELGDDYLDLREFIKLADKKGYNSDMLDSMIKIANISFSSNNKSRDWLDIAWSGSVSNVALGLQMKPDILTGQYISALTELTRNSKSATTAVVDGQKVLRSGILDKTGEEVKNIVFKLLNLDSKKFNKLSHTRLFRTDIGNPASSYGQGDLVMGRFNLNRISRKVSGEGRGLLSSGIENAVNYWGLGVFYQKLLDATGGNINKYRTLEELLQSKEGQKAVTDLQIEFMRVIGSGSEAGLAKRFRIEDGFSNVIRRTFTSLLPYVFRAGQDFRIALQSSVQNQIKTKYGYNQTKVLKSTQRIWEASTVYQTSKAITRNHISKVSGQEADERGTPEAILSDSFADFIGLYAFQLGLPAGFALNSAYQYLPSAFFEDKSIRASAIRAIPVSFINEMGIGLKNIINTSIDLLSDRDDVTSKDLLTAIMSAAYLGAITTQFAPLQGGLKFIEKEYLLAIDEEHQTRYANRLASQILKTNRVGVKDNYLKTILDIEKRLRNSRPNSEWGKIDEPHKVYNHLLRVFNKDLGNPFRQNVNKFNQLNYIVSILELTEKDKKIFKELYYRSTPKYSEAVKRGIDFSQASFWVDQIKPSIWKKYISLKDNDRLIRLIAEKEDWDSFQEEKFKKNLNKLEAIYTLNN